MQCPLSARARTDQSGGRACKAGTQQGMVCRNQCSCGYLPLKEEGVLYHRLQNLKPQLPGSQVLPLSHLTLAVR